MTEILTDELLDEMYPKYRLYLNICQYNEGQPVTFEKFVESQLKIRMSKIDKLKERGILVK